MKLNQFLFTCIAATTLVVAGCSKSSDSGIDTSKLSAVFQTAETDAKTAVDSVATAVKNADYSGAMTQLKALGEKFKLSPEQQQEVKNLTDKMQKAMEDAASKAATEAGKAATDLGNSIKK